ncbi:MAG TPA: NAD-dependent epimerase/dehydratase family protein [Chitinophagales bacterium]|nr:NAD-dependent epimerase/dehydratase family protein [Chitinophagales bacterium]
MKKQILILGGTMFVGRAVVEKLRTLPDYEITLFNRGKSNAGLFDDIKQLHGNRETDDILQVCNQHWDCVIDFSGYYPVTFEKLLHDLYDKVGRYIFISTISVYELEKFNGRPITENDEIHYCSEEQKISKLPDAYGEKKAEMERVLLRQTGLDKIILRPSFIYGRYDWTERFYYWLYRAKFLDKILIPANFKLVLTYADDLATAIVNAIKVKEHKTIYNTISESGIPVKQVVNDAAALLNSKVEFVQANDELTEKGQVHQSAFPLYVPFDFSIEGSQWLKDFNVLPTGFENSLKETIAYHDSLNWAHPKAGMTVEEEREIVGK